MNRANSMTDVAMLVEHQASYRLKARRGHAVHQTSPGATVIAADFSGENLLVGVE